MKKFYGTGTDHYSDIWEKIAFENDAYRWGKNDLQEFYYGDKVYEFDYKAVFALLPEDDNEHDENAVAITADGEICAYIKKGSASQVRNLLAAGIRYSIEAEGGRYKDVGDSIDKDKNPIRVTVTFYDDPPKPVVEKQEKKKSKLREIINLLFGV